MSIPYPTSEKVKLYKPVLDRTGFDTQILEEGVDTHLSKHPRLREKRPNGDYSATWDEFKPGAFRWYIPGTPWTVLRISQPRVTIAVTIKPETRYLNVEFRGFTVFNWTTSSDKPMYVTLRLKNAIGGVVQPEETFPWSLECLPCHDHATVIPHQFRFPELYEGVEQVEILYSDISVHKCDKKPLDPCQPADIP